MRYLIAAIALSFVGDVGQAQQAKTQPAETAKQAPKIVLKSPDGKQSYDLAELVEKGPVLIRLTCACIGCDAELASFQKLQETYNDRGLQTIAVFREKPEALESYVVKKQIRFMWLSDPKGELWKTFDAKTMPTNILIAKGGKVVRVVSGCTIDGKNARTLAEEIEILLPGSKKGAPEVPANGTFMRPSGSQPAAAFMNPYGSEPAGAYLNPYGSQPAGVYLNPYAPLP
jgi:peroxiredoxin